MINKEFLTRIHEMISEQISDLERADNADSPDAAQKMREDVQDRLQELVIEIVTEINDAE